MEQEVRCCLIVLLISSVGWYDKDGFELFSKIQGIDHVVEKYTHKKTLEKGLMPNENY